MILCVTGNITVTAVAYCATAHACARETTLVRQSENNMSRHCLHTDTWALPVMYLPVARLECIIQTFITRVHRQRLVYYSLIYHGDVRKRSMKTLMKLKILLLLGVILLPACNDDLKVLTWEHPEVMRTSSTCRGYLPPLLPAPNLRATAARAFSTPQLCA